MAAKWCDFRPRGHLKRIFTVFKWPAGESLGAFVRNTIGGYPVGETLSEYFEFCVVFCSNNVDWRAIDAVFRRGLRVLLGTALQVYLDPDELPSAAMLDFIRTVDAEPQVDVEWQGVTYHAPRGCLFFTRNWFDGLPAPEYEEHWHCRLFRRTAGRWYKRIHEQIALEGFPEEETRGTPGMPKAPLAAHLLHSRMSDPAIDADYARIERA